VASAAIGEDHPMALVIRNDRVVCLRRLGRLDEALSEAEDVLARHLSDPRWRETAIAESYDRIAAIHLDARDYDAAAAAMQSAIRFGEVAFGPEHPRMADILFNYGELLINQGDLTGAEANYRRLIELDSKLRGPEHPYVVSERHNLARTVSLQGRNEEALGMLEELLEMEDRVGLASERMGIATNFEAMRVLAELGRFDEAIPRGLAQLAAMEAAGQDELIDQLWVHGKLAYVYGKAGDTEAEARHRALAGDGGEGEQ
ncbi:MAG: tetratricopeptide repeat protein, partial [Planctomycetota bacterium]